jgi:hypothetical protein
MVFKFFSKVTYCRCYWPEAASPNGQIVFPSIFFEYSQQINILFVQNQFRFCAVLSNHPVPSRQGVHCPQDSW